jgi:hypothetical protein
MRTRKKTRKPWWSVRQSLSTLRALRGAEDAEKSLFTTEKVKIPILSQKRDKDGATGVNDFVE